MNPGCPPRVSAVGNSLMAVARSVNTSDHSWRAYFTSVEKRADFKARFTAAAASAAARDGLFPKHCSTLRGHRTSMGPRSVVNDALPAGPCSLTSSGCAIFAPDSLLQYTALRKRAGAAAADATETMLPSSLRYTHGLSARTAPIERATTITARPTDRPNQRRYRVRSLR